MQKWSSGGGGCQLLSTAALIFLLRLHLLNRTSISTNSTMKYRDRQPTQFTKRDKEHFWNFNTEHNPTSTQSWSPKTNWQNWSLIKKTNWHTSRGSRKRKHRPLNNKFLNLCCIVNVPKKFSHTQSMLFPSISLFSTGCTLPAIECLLLMNDLIERFEEGRKKQEQTTWYKNICRSRGEEKEGNSY